VQRELLVSLRAVSPAGHLWYKRCLDVFLILILSPVLLVLMTLVAIVIKAGSPGPVFFRQVRVGYMGRPFKCLKFRTMREDADTRRQEDYFKSLVESDQPMLKLDCRGDQRLVPLGAWLRASGLDELPQALNVLRGEMSIVGPRPCTPLEFLHYRPSQLERFLASPGITGLWQVSGKNHLSFNSMVRLDIHYVRERSVWLDLVILGKTGSAIWGQVREVWSIRRAGQGEAFVVEL
jgi:lipopolysaccharide/colanic/teichoic acid biosynthesis glycosyltransferase